MKLPVFHAVRLMLSIFFVFSTTIVQLCFGSFEFDNIVIVCVLQVLDKKKDRKTLATGNVKLKHVRNEPGMIWTKPIRLEHKVTTSPLETNLYVTIALRAMTLRKLDASAIADATDGFFLYGAATRRDVTQAELAATFSSTMLDKKNRKKSVSSLPQSSSKSQLRSSSRLSNSNLPIAEEVDGSRLEPAADDVTMRTPQRPLRANAAASKSSPPSSASANSINRNGSASPSDFNRPNTAFRNTDDREQADAMSVIDYEGESSVLLNTPNIFRRFVAATRPSKPTQYDDAEVDAADAGEYSLGKLKVSSAFCYLLFLFSFCFCFFSQNTSVFNVVNSLSVICFLFI